MTRALDALIKYAKRHHNGQRCGQALCTDLGVRGVIAVCGERLLMELLEVAVERLAAEPPPQPRPAPTPPAGGVPQPEMMSFKRDLPPEVAAMVRVLTAQHLGVAPDDVHVEDQIPVYRVDRP